MLLKLFGLFDPIMREISKMDYQWRHPMELRDERLDALLGKGFGTSFEAAVAATVAPLFAAPTAIRNAAELPRAVARLSVFGWLVPRRPLALSGAFCTNLNAS